MSETAERIQHHYEVSPDRVARIAAGCANRNAGLAGLLGQPCDVTAASLEALYYRQRGLCAISQIPMTDYKQDPRFGMELDHIVPVDRNESLRTATGTSVSSRSGGMAGMMNNVRWVCRAAHRMRHWTESSGVSLNEFCASVAATATTGCRVDPSRTSDLFERKGRLEIAKDYITGLISESATFRTVHDIHGECNRNGIFVSVDVVRRIIKSLVGGDLREWSKKARLQVLQEFISNCRNADGLIPLPINDVYKAFKLRLSEAGIPSTTTQQFRNDLLEIGFMQYSVRNKPGRSAKARNALRFFGAIVWDWAKKRGPNGFRFIDLSAEMDHMSVDVLRDVLADSVSRRLIDSYGDMFFARLNRTEAARFVGLSRDVLKKYAVIGKGPAYEFATSMKHGTFVTYAFRDLILWRQMYPKKTRDLVSVHK